MTRANLKEPKDQELLLRLSKKEMEKLMLAYKQRLIIGDYISRSEYIRQLILNALELNEK
jgi:hypothetical protein